MIRQLSLQNWRSYEVLSLRLGPGTTFVVAPNGVGKTSLVYGLAWGVFGHHCDFDPKTCIRAGAPSATSQVELDLPIGRRLHIQRKAPRRGSPTSTYKLSGIRVDEGTAHAEMEGAFGIELQIAGRLSMMLGGGHVSSSAALDLESHLNEVFGVNKLREAADVAKDLVKKAQKSRLALRDSTKRRLANRAELESEISEARAMIKEFNLEGEVLERARKVASSQRSLVERHHTIAKQITQFKLNRVRLVAEIGKVLDGPIGGDSDEAIGPNLRAALSNTEAEIEVLSKRVLKARSVAVASEQAIEILKAHGKDCPTCLRPFLDDDQHAALISHKGHVNTASAGAKRLTAAREAKQVQANTMRRLLAQLEALPAQLDHEPMGNLPSQLAAEAAFNDAVAGLDIHNRKLGALQSRLELLESQIATDDQIAKDENALRLAYRREAAAQAGATALNEAADLVIKSRIQPMAREIQSHWKHLFTSNGLAFNPDGSISRVRGGETLEWDTLSGGERTWARIVTHLIVMATTTTLPFAWFDEPLEHLDPHLRHAVAATLATATRGGCPSQLLVTTYEHGIARQLAEDTDCAEIVAIRGFEPSLESYRNNPGQLN